MANYVRVQIRKSVCKLDTTSKLMRSTNYGNRGWYHHQTWLSHPSEPALAEPELKDVGPVMAWHRAARRRRASPASSLVQARRVNLTYSIP